MANVNTNNISVPRIARNKRIYAGNTAISKSVQSGAGSPSLEWVSVSPDEVIVNRDTVIQGDLTVQNLSGLAGDTVIVNENGTFGTVREVINEVPSGAIDGVNATYTLAHVPDGLIRLYKNGQKLKLSLDYTIVDDTITLVTPLISDGYTDVLLCDYRYITYSPGGEPVPANPDYINWTPMARGAAASATGFDLHICRVNRHITISGQFQFINGSGVDSVIASISSLIIAEGLTLSRKIYCESNEISSGETNRGMAVYVDTFDPTVNPVLRIKAREAHDAGLAFMTISFNVL